MKKIIALFIAFVIGMTASVSAMSLEEAFKALSHLPNMSMKEDDAQSTIVIDGKIDSVGPMKIAMAGHLDRKEIFRTGNDVLAILNQIPLSYMIIGCSNGIAAAFLYTTPLDNDEYAFLAILMSSEAGDVTVIYSTINSISRECFQNARLSLEGPKLSIIPERKEGASVFNLKIGQ